MNRVDYLLAELRCAWLRARLIAAEIENISTALKAGEISEDLALALVVQTGLASFCSERFELTVCGERDEYQHFRGAGPVAAHDAGQDPHSAAL